MHIPANAVLFAAIAGLSHAAIFMKSDRDERPVARKSLLFAIGAFPAACLALYLPAKDFLADHHYRQVARLLDDKATVPLDVKPITAGTMTSYLEAFESLKKAADIAPKRSTYPRALADLHFTLGNWATSMETMKAPLPAGAPSGSAETSSAPCSPAGRNRPNPSSREPRPPCVSTARDSR
jgi:hypothetical protein